MDGKSMRIGVPLVMARIWKGSLTGVRLSLQAGCPRHRTMRAVIHGIIPTTFCSGS